MDSTADPPRGFEVAAADDGGCVILYRTRGMGCAALFFAVWLGIWTVGCVAMANGALFQPDGINFLLLLFMIPFWLPSSLSRLTSPGISGQSPGSRSGRNSRRRRNRHKDRSTTAVRQTKDGGEGEDSFPSWALAIIGQMEIRVLSKQPIEKSNWLGPVVAQWAGLAFEPCEPAKARNYETL